jgi:hypothetical protein
MTYQVVTYGKFYSMLQLVVCFQFGFHIVHICLQASKLVDLHQLTGHHALTWWLPICDLSLVARHLVARVATHIVEAATD